jgi:hypothetical protein
MRVAFGIEKRSDDLHLGVWDGNKREDVFECVFLMCI